VVKIKVIFPTFFDLFFDETQINYQELKEIDLTKRIPELLPYLPLEPDKPIYVEKKEHSFLIIKLPEFTPKICCLSTNKKQIFQTENNFPENKRVFFNHCFFLIGYLTNDRLKAEQLRMQLVELAFEEKTNTFKNEELLRKNAAETLDSLEFETIFFAAISKGSYATIDWAINNYKSTFLAKLSAHTLLDYRYRFVSFITLLARISLQENVTPTWAFAKSDYYIFQMNNVTDEAALFQLTRAAAYEFANQIQIMRYQTDNSQIRNCLFYIDDHLYERIQLTDLAKLTGYTPTYFSSFFTKQMGQTFKQYLLQKRVEEACHLLIETTLSYTEIAELLQFPSHSAFIKHFKKHKQQTPRTYRLASSYYTKKIPKNEK
jgi:YesN/AraC family two-component response regulator